MADNAGAETFILSSATADSEYYLAANFYAAMSSIPKDLEITITFDQVGTINGDRYSFPAALNTAFICKPAYNVFAKVITTGDTYSIEELVKRNFVAQQIAWTHGTDVIDAFVPEADCAGTLIKRLNKGWLKSTWGKKL